jgi:hypothetical protein
MTLKVFLRQRRKESVLSGGKKGKLELRSFGRELIRPAEKLFCRHRGKNVLH